MADVHAYTQVLELLFRQGYRKGAKRVPFSRADIIEAAKTLKVADRIKNPGDVLYDARYRRGIPPAIAKTAPAGKEWRIVSVGKARHEFQLAKAVLIAPNAALAKIKIPDATPGIVSRYALSDEQALLAVIRYNRLIDVFSGTTCYSLQNHLRTSVKGLGQTETDEIYVGVDKRGAHYVYPIQAKGGRDSINVVQILQDLAMCREKFKGLICRPVAAQFLADDTVALFELQDQGDEVRIAGERHYILVPPEELKDDDLRAYSLPGDG